MKISIKTPQANSNKDSTQLNTKNSTSYQELVSNSLLATSQLQTIVGGGGRFDNYRCLG